MPRNLRHWLLALTRGPMFRPTLITVAAGLVLVSLPPLACLSYDASYLVRGRAAITNLVIVVFDDKTLDDLGSDHNELSRVNHARLLERLATDEDKPRLVLYDMLFAETNQNPEVDQRLANAMKRQGSVILAAQCKTFEINGHPMQSLTKPLALLRNAAAGWGHTELYETPLGGQTRRQISPECGEANYAIWIAALHLKTNVFASANPNLDRWLNYYGPPNSRTIPQFRFQDVVNATAPASSNVFKDKIVLVGEAYDTLAKVGGKRESFPTPYSRFGYRPMSGVEIHATALLNLLRDDWLRPTPLLWQWGAACLWGIAIPIALYAVSGKSRMMLLITCAAAVLLLIAGSLYVQWHFYRWWCWIGPAFGQTTTALAFVWLSPKRDPYIAFISYRTEDDGAAALLISRSLAERGLKAFIDVRSLESGKFDEQLLSEIQKSTFFIPILSQRCLARCADPNDWVLRELSHALSLRKVIIPVIRPGFSFSANNDVPNLPQIAELSRYHGVHYSNRDFEGFLEQLIARLKARPTAEGRTTKN